MEEIWKPVPGYEGIYEISNQGGIRSLPRVGRGKGNSRQSFPGCIMKPYTDKDGYKRVKLCLNGVAKKFYIHNLMLRTFVGEAPDGHCCGHMNGIPDDNRLENLKWITFSENEAHMKIHGTVMWGSKNHATKLTETQVKEIKKRLRLGEKPGQIVDDYPVTIWAIRSIQLKNTWYWLEEDIG